MEGAGEGLRSFGGWRGCGVGDLVQSTSRPSVRGALVIGAKYMSASSSCVLQVVLPSVDVDASGAASPTPRFAAPRAA